METMTFGDLLESTEDAQGSELVFVDVEGRYIGVTDVTVEGNQIVITLEDD